MTLRTELSQKKPREERKKTCLFPRERRENLCLFPFPWQREEEEKHMSFSVRNRLYTTYNVFFFPLFALPSLEKKRRLFLRGLSLASTCWYFSWLFETS